VQAGWRRKVLRPAAVALALWLERLARPARAFAHEGEPFAPHDLWYAWNFDPLILVSLLTFGALFARGLGTFRSQGQPVAWWRVLAFCVALLAAAVALISPLDALSGALFSAHMVQHLLLIMVTAPLVALAAPVAPLLRGLPRRFQVELGQAWHKLPPARSALRWFSYGWVAWLLHTAAVWLWHLPGPYQAALTNDLLHALEHVALLGSALLYWSAVIRPSGKQQQEASGLALLSVIAMAMQGSVLGALMTFSPEPWYPAYAETAVVWGLTPLEDQQIAGALMWVPPGAVYTVVAIGLFGLWLRRMEGNVSKDRLGPRAVAGPRSGGRVVPGSPPSPEKEM
jgi:putative membrane protein